MISNFKSSQANKLTWIPRQYWTIWCSGSDFITDFEWNVDSSSDKHRQHVVLWTWFSTRDILTFGQCDLWLILSNFNEFSDRKKNSTQKQNEILTKMHTTWEFVYGEAMLSVYFVFYFILLLFLSFSFALLRAVTLWKRQCEMY